MPEYLSPGVYVEEIEIGAKPIEGISTSTVGFLGETERGPTLPRPVTSWLEYQRLFGDYFGTTNYLPYAIEGFFRNGGQRCYVARIVKPSATLASATLKASDNTDALVANATGEGSWGNRVAIKVSKGSLAGTFKISLFYWKKSPSKLYDPEVDVKSSPRPSVMESMDNVSLDESSPDFYVSKAASLSNLIAFGDTATKPTKIPGVIQDKSTSISKINGSAKANIVLAAATPSNLFSKNLWIEVTDSKGQKQVARIISYNEPTHTAEVDVDWNIGTSDSYDYTLYWLQLLSCGSDALLFSEAQAQKLQPDPYATLNFGTDASAEDDFYKDKTVEITSGTGKGQSAKISAYDGEKKVANIDPKWPTVPDSSSRFNVKMDLASGKVVKLESDADSRVQLESSASGDYANMKILLSKEGEEPQKRTIKEYDKDKQIAVVDQKWAVIPDEKWSYDVYDEFSGTVPATDPDPYVSINLGTTIEDFQSFKDNAIVITDGTGQGQRRIIESVEDDSDAKLSTAKVTEKWTVVPDETSEYLIENSKLALTSGDFERVDTNTPGQKKGLTGFAEIDDISIIYSPNALGLNIHSTLIDHCENLKNRFAIIDSKVSAQPEKPADSKYAAFYYPWINIVDPVSGSLLLVPPGGHIAGVYARTDTERGVHKAPANETVKGADSTQFIISKAAQDLLNPKGVNCIRAFSGRGIRVWGARTMSSDPLWKYINVRRLFLFLEGSIENSTQWVVFEPSNEKLWARVKQTISQFLTTVWKNGALMGTTPEEAFFVKCDRTTMTQDDIDNGRLVVMIGVAPTKPAEFVIFRIAQWQGGSAATE